MIHRAILPWIILNNTWKCPNLPEANGYCKEERFPLTEKHCIREFYSLQCESSQAI